MAKLIKPSYDTCIALTKAIDAYIAKANDDLSEEMADAGYVDSKDSVKGANELEEEVSEILTEQTQEIAEVVEGAGTIPKAKKKVKEYFENDTTGVLLSDTFVDYFQETVMSLSNAYMKETEGDLVVSELRQRTSSWIYEWSDQLSDLMQLSSENQMGTLLQQALDNGESCMTLAQRLINEGIRNEGYRARATAVTEMLRAHSVSQQEAIMQSPATDRKKWVHSGAHKNKPRENHVAMSGQIVPKAEPFELTGRDGGTYHPMYPRDPVLPAAETINCHCIHIPISNDDVLGLSYEERQQMQQDIIAADNGEWEKDLDRQNRLRSGLSENLGEQEESQDINANTLVDKQYIYSKEYSEKFQQFGEEKSVTKKIRATSIEMLKHRSGTVYEDLTYVYTTGGSPRMQMDYEDEDHVEPTKKMEEKRKSVPSHTVIGIHNHPKNPEPSLADLRACRDRKYKYGVVVCHNGRIYKYSVSDDFNEPMAAGGLAFFRDLDYTLTQEEADDIISKAINVLRKSGVEMEVY